jgi:hypothetical protein
VFLVLLLAAVACTGGEDPKPVGPTFDPDAAQRDARARLAVLARATADGAYDAEYRFLQTDSKASGTVRIRQAPPRYRIDIQARRSASFFALMSGVVSCSTKGTKESCFLVARPGEEVPSLFDPGVQRLFRDAVEQLAADPNAYLVEKVDPPTPTPSAAPRIPAGECFRVSRAASTPSPDQPAGFEDGTYCFAEQGVATSITVSSGTLTLVKLGGAPKAAAFKPPAKVQKLPDLSPTPSPKK